MRNENAFTFIEIVVAMFIFSIIGAIIAGGVISGNKVKASQEALIEIQQNVRVANMLMARDIRMAGYDIRPHFNTLIRRVVDQIVGGKSDPDGKNCPNNSDTLQFQQVELINGVNSTSTITYYVQDWPVGGEVQRALLRRYQNAAQPIVANQDRTDVVATNIDALWVTYYVSDGSNTLLWSGAPANPPSPLPAVMAGIPITRAIGVTLVGRSTKVNNDFSGYQRTFTEPNVGGDRTFTLADRFDRRMYSTVIGLNNFNAQM
jgi:prepilin-type N-terminal cleavage/methylation domain-containing protein